MYTPLAPDYTGWLGHVAPLEWDGLHCHIVLIHYICSGGEGYDREGLHVALQRRGLLQCCQAKASVC